MVPEPQMSTTVAGSVLPIKAAEELLSTLPGIISARIIAGHSGGVDEIHVLTTTEVAPKQTVRNIESALIAHLGMKVDHRKISIATSVDPRRARDGRPNDTSAVSATKPALVTEVSVATPVVVVPIEPVKLRAYYFEDVELRRSRTTGITCRVTLSKGDTSFSGEAEGMESARSRIELAAKAALRAIAEGESGSRPFELEGAKVVGAFDREFIFVGVTVQQSRETVLLTGSCEVKDSQETASVLAALDATNRWLSRRH